MPCPVVGRGASITSVGDVVAELTAIAYHLGQAANQAAHAADQAERGHHTITALRGEHALLRQSAEQFHTAANKARQAQQNLHAATQAIAAYIAIIGGAASSPAPGQAAHTNKASAPRAHFGYTDDYDYRKTFFTAHPDTKDKVVVHHAVEQQTMIRYPLAGITMNEMHSLENLRGIPKGEVNNRIHLSEIRKKWNNFYRDNPSPTKTQLLDFATEIDNRYGHEFNPPIR